MVDLVRDMYLYLPDKDVTELAKRFGVPLELHKARMSRELVNLMPPQELADTLNEYRCAGRGAVHLYEPTKGGEPLELTRQNVSELITRVYGQSIFEVERRPPLSEEPQVINAISLSDDEMMLQMAHLEVRTRLVEYELLEEEQIVFTRMVIRLDPLFLECHANRDKAKVMTDELAEVLGADYAEPVVFTDDVVESLINSLHGILILAKHKHERGDYDTTEVVVNPELGDLRLSNDYTSGLGREPGRRKRISFECPPSSQQYVTVEIYPKTGTIWFRSNVNKQVTDYVFSQIAAITSAQARNT